MSAAYARVSSEEQREKQTIKTQIDLLTGWLPEPVEWYLDDGASGTVPLSERPESLRLLRDIQAGRHRTVYVSKLDRLARGARNLLNAIHELEQLKARVVSATESVDTGTPAGRAMLGMLGVFSGFERDTFIERATQGRDRRAREGKWPGSPVPYGYRRDGDWVAIDEEPIPGHPLSPAEVVRHVYRRLCEGSTCYQIALQLNEWGLPTPYGLTGRIAAKTGKPASNLWVNTRLAAVVRNPTYKGEHYYSPRKILLPVPALVTAEEWQAAQERIEQNRKLPIRPGTRFYLLRGLVRCARCGCLFTGYKSGGQSYYICNGGHLWKATGVRAQELRCGSKNLSAPKAEEEVWQLVLKRLARPELFDPPPDVDPIPVLSELARTEEALAGKAAERERMLGLFRRGLVTESELETQLVEIAAEADRLRDRRTVLTAQKERALADVRRVTDREAVVAECLEILDAGDDVARRRAVIERLVEEVRVFTHEERGRKRASLEVRWKL